MTTATLLFGVWAMSLAGCKAVQTELPHASASWPASKLPQLQKSKQRTDIAEYGEEPTVSGVYIGNAAGLVAWFGAQGVTIALPSVPESDRPLMVDLAEPTRVTTVLEAVAAQFPDEPRVLRRGPAIYMVGQPTSADMASRVYYVTAESASSFESAVGVLLSRHAQVRAVADMVVVRDTPDGIAAADSLWAAMFGARGQYLVEVRFVEIAKSWAQSVGIDWSLVGSIDLQAISEGMASGTTGIAAAQLVAMLEADESSEGATLLTMSRLHVVEGEDALLQVGQTTPIARRTVSDAGTVSTTSYDQIDTGLIVRVGVRSEPDGRLRVRLSPELSDVTGFVGDAPIRSRRRIQTAAVVEPGGVVVVGGFSREQTRDGVSGLPGFQAIGKRQRNKESTRLFVVLRVLDPTLPMVDDVSDGDVLSSSP